MYYIDSSNTFDPTLNLALEEYALTNFDLDESYLLFYINEPSIIIGKNQNTFAEINPEYVQEHGIHVVRRLSGGGAVYHDRGNLNFSFITKNDGNAFRNFHRFTEPIIAALRKLGVQAELTGRNDIQVGDRKISGNAQFATKGRMFSHGTLLFDVNLDNIAQALRVDADKIASKGIASVRSRVANIREFLQEDMTIEMFRETLLQFLFEGRTVPVRRLTDVNWNRVHELAEQRYRNWNWNFGKSPEFNLQRRRRFPAGTIDVKLLVKDGLIEMCKIYGDFFCLDDILDIETSLIGRRYLQDDLMAALSVFDLNRYFGNVSAEQFVSLLLR